MSATMEVYLAWAAWAAVLLGGAALSSLYSGMETGMYVINKIRLELHAEAGSPAARFLRRMIRNSNNLLAVLLVGTNLARYAATFSVTSMFVMAGYGHRAEWYTLAVAAPLMFVVGDAVPKSVFRRAAGELMYRLAWLLRVSNWVFGASGLVPLIRGISVAVMRLAGIRRGWQSPLAHPGLAAIMAEGHASGVLTQFQSLMADRVMRIGDVTLRDAMAPMRHVVSAPLDVGHEQLMQTIRKHDYSRVPLLGPDGQVAGILDVYDVLAEAGEVRPAETMAEPFVLPATMAVADALYRMQRARAAMAIVADEKGRHVGIVTVKDLVEEIVGELEEW